MEKTKIASGLIVIADAGLLAWGAMAALAPELLPGPGGAPILPAGYAGFAKGSWAELVRTAPMAARFMAVLFRVYGAYIVAFSLTAIAIAHTAFRRGERWAWWTLFAGNTIAYPAAMAYDLTVGAIGPFERTEYLGLAVIYGALAVTFQRNSGSVSTASGSATAGLVPSVSVAPGADSLNRTVATRPSESVS